MQGHIHTQHWWRCTTIPLPVWYGTQDNTIAYMPFLSSHPNLTYAHNCLLIANWVQELLLQFFFPSVCPLPLWFFTLSCFAPINYHVTSIKGEGRMITCYVACAKCLIHTACLLHAPLIAPVTCPKNMYDMDPKHA